MKKITAINCSPRSIWNTATLVREAARGAEGQDTLGTFVGPVKIRISSNILQVKDYRCYNWTMFDQAHKKERHETLFPEDR